jgi:hypothetical protein
MTWDFGSATLREGALSATISNWLNCSDCSNFGTFWMFSSDLETPLTPGSLNTPTSNFIEDGTAQIVLTISYRNANLAVVGADTLAIQSDVADGGAPEPSTWIMALSGLGLVGFALRRQRA